MLVYFGFRGLTGYCRATRRHAHYRAHRSRRAGIDYTPLAECGRKRTNHILGDPGLLFPAQRRKFTYLVLAFLPESIQLRQEFLPPSGKISLFRPFLERTQRNRISARRIRITGAVAAVMLDENRFVALWGRRQYFFRHVIDPVASGSQIPVGKHFRPCIFARRGRHFHKAEMRVEHTFSGMIVFPVAGRIVHHVGDRIPFPAYAEGGRSAAVHIQCMAWMEMPFEETGKLPGRHPFAYSLLAAVHGHHQEMAVRCKRHRRAGMPDALMANGILIIVSLELFRRQGTVDKESSHGLEVVDQHRGAGENILPWRRSIECPLLRNAPALAVKCYADVPAAAVYINRALAFPVWHGCGHHCIFGHARVIVAVFFCND